MYHFVRTVVVKNTLAVGGAVGGGGGGGVFSLFYEVCRVNCRTEDNERVESRRVLMDVGCRVRWVRRARFRSRCSRPPTASCARRPATSPCSGPSSTRPRTSSTPSASHLRAVARPSRAASSASRRPTADTVDAVWTTYTSFFRRSPSSDQNDVVSRDNREKNGPRSRTCITILCIRNLYSPVRDKAVAVKQTEKQR